MSRIPGFVLQPGFRPFDHRLDLLRQPSQVQVIEGLDVRVRRWLLHPNGGPVSPDGHDDLQLLRWGGLALSVVRTFRVLFGLALRVLVFDNLGSRSVHVIAEQDVLDDPGWRLDEIYFVPPEPVPGRRIYLERLAVSGNTANVALRAAHDLDLKVRVFGGREGKTLRMGANTSLVAGEAKSFNLTLNGPSPSFTFSWADTLGRSGAVSLKSHQIPYPLPQADGGLCDLEVTSLEWTPGQITGVIASECIAETRQEVALPVYGGHFSQTSPALLDATVTRITGTVNVAAGTHRASASFVAGGETRFRLPVPNRKAVHNLEITADLAATLNVPLPPMLQTTHHPAWTQVITRRVSLPCGEGSSVSRTVRVYVYHPEHVRAVEAQRAPATRTRAESIPLAASVGADDPHQALHVPPPKPPPPTAEQTPVGDSSWWSWPW